MWTPPEDTSDLFDEPHELGSFTPMIGDDSGQYAGFNIRSGDWEALYLLALGCNHATAFAEQIPQYPMLSRLQDIYGLYRFDPNEAAALRAECLAVAQTCQYDPAFRTLRKLIAACDMANGHGVGFCLIGD